MLPMKIQNERRPKIGPFDTPGSILHHSLKMLFKFTLWNRPDKYFWTNSTAFKEKPYAFSLPSNKLQWSPSNVLGRFINTVPLSRTRFQFPVIFSKAFCVLRFWRNPANRDENLDLKKRFIWLITLLSDILDAWERIFT